MDPAVAESFHAQTAAGAKIELSWHRAWSRVTVNGNGSTGWATVVATSVDAAPYGGGILCVEAGKVVRVHLCSHEPCSAMFTNNKYGLFGPPLHVRLSGVGPLAIVAASMPLPVEPAVAVAVDGENGAAQLEPPLVDFAVADVVLEGEGCGPTALLPGDTPVAKLDLAELVHEVDACAPAETAVAEVEEALPPSAPITPPMPLAPVAPLPASPLATALRIVSAAAPLDVVFSQSAPPSQAAVRLPQVAEAAILDKLMRLAREIRRPQQYIGYSAFVLFGLAKKCRPVMWEGEERVDLLDTFAPWALEHCNRICGVDGVCCCLEVASSGHPVMRPVSSDNPLHECKHFVACTSIDGDLACDGMSFQAFYQRLGVILLGTVVDGDCGLDVCCQMLSLPQTFENRVALREECCGAV